MNFTRKNNNKRSADNERKSFDKACLYEEKAVVQWTCYGG